MVFSNLATTSNIAHWVSRQLNVTSSCEVKGKLPRRVIDVVATCYSKTVILAHFEEDIKPQDERYICLSRCWGGEISCSLTKRSYKEIKVESLIPSFHDAISFTEKLGIRYLWIDALYIFQDSSEDWVTESAKMGSYYSGAWLTLAANMPDHDNQGIFGALNQSRPFYLKLEVDQVGNKPPSTLYFNFPPIQPSLRHSKVLCPLGSRYWTLQEEP